MRVWLGRTIATASKTRDSEPWNIQNEAHSHGRGIWSYGYGQGLSRVHLHKGEVHIATRVAMRPT